MLSSIGRNAVRRVGVGQPQASSARVSELTWQIQRVSIALTSSDATKVRSRLDTWVTHSFRRTYATATKVASKSRAKKAITAGKAVTTRKSTRGSAKKAVAKPKAKPKKKKVATKPKPRVKKVLTEAQKSKRAEVQAKVELKALKTTALLSPPKSLPATAWSVLVAEMLKGQAGQGFPGLTKSIGDIATRYKNLDPSNREHYNHIANQNKLANDAAYTTWVESHTPDQIRAANTARTSLKRKFGKRGTKVYTLIEDPRIPKRPVNVMAAFTKERWASGDMKGISVVDANKALMNEWKTLSSAGKKHFEDLAAAERTRYAQEHKAVFHRDLPARQKAAATS